MLVSKVVSSCISSNYSLLHHELDLSVQLLRLKCLFFQAVESQQCLEGKLTTVQFRKEEVRLPGDFWTRGVDNSKIILETILDKIKSYEQISESSWIEFVRDNFALENLEVQNGENWF